LYALAGASSEHERDHATERDQHARVDLFQMLLDRNTQTAAT
jgi:hypothetical protein